MNWHKRKWELLQLFLGFSETLELQEDMNMHTGTRVSPGTGWFTVIPPGTSLPEVWRALAHQGHRWDSNIVPTFNSKSDYEYVHLHRFMYSVLDGSEWWVLRSGGLNFGKTMLCTHRIGVRAGLDAVEKGRISISQRNRPRFSGNPARNLITVMTELSLPITK